MVTSVNISALSHAPLMIQALQLGQSWGVIIKVYKCSQLNPQGIITAGLSNAQPILGMANKISILFLTKFLALSVPGSANEIRLQGTNYQYHYVDKIIRQNDRITINSKKLKDCNSRIVSYQQQYSSFIQEIFNKGVERSQLTSSSCLLWRTSSSCLVSVLFSL